MAPTYDPHPGTAEGGGVCVRRCLEPLGGNHGFVLRLQGLSAPPPCSAPWAVSSSLTACSKNLLSGLLQWGSTGDRGARVSWARRLLGCHSRSLVAVSRHAMLASKFRGHEKAQKRKTELRTLPSRQTATVSGRDDVDFNVTPKAASGAVTPKAAPTLYTNILGVAKDTCLRVFGARRPPRR